MTDKERIEQMQKQDAYTLEDVRWLIERIGKMESTLKKVHEQCASDDSGFAADIINLIEHAMSARKEGE